MPCYSDDEEHLRGGTWSGKLGALGVQSATAHPDSMNILGCDGCLGDSRAVSFVTRSILDATSIYRCTAVLRWQLHTRSHFTILGQGSVSGDTVCRVHRAPSSEGGAGSTKRRCDLFGTPWGPCLECSREVSPRGLPLLENQVLSTAHASARATSSGRTQSCMHWPLLTTIRRRPAAAVLTKTTKPPPPHQTSLRGR